MKINATFECGAVLGLTRDGMLIRWDDEAKEAYDSEQTIMDLGGWGTLNGEEFARIVDPVVLYAASDELTRYAAHQYLYAEDYDYARAAKAMFDAGTLAEEHERQDWHTPEGEAITVEQLTAVMQILNDECGDLLRAMQANPGFPILT
jgi:hypothetical protein